MLKLLNAIRTILRQSKKFENDNDLKMNVKQKSLNDDKKKIQKKIEKKKHEKLK